MSSESAKLATRDEIDVATLLHGLDSHLQPIVDVATGAVVAVEALARFPQVPQRPVDEVIAAAHAAGHGLAIEAACLRSALSRRADVPANIRLALNISPDVLVSPMLARSWDADLTGVIVEITEHWASRPEVLKEQFARLRDRGAAIAVDDVGAGYAGMLRVATMRPDYVKVDRTIVNGLRDDEAKRAVLEALVSLSHRTGAAVIAEGIESLDDITPLAELDVDFGQGWAIGRPAPYPEPISRAVVDACREARAVVLQRRPAFARTVDMHAVAGALAGATRLADLHAATARAAAQFGIDVISASVLDPEGILREITSSGAAIDTAAYAVRDYPATRTVLETGDAVEVHVEDAEADPAEVAWLRRRRNASLLILPLSVGEHCIGVLEFMHRTHRRWSTGDIVNARALATHLGNALLRVTA
jgi:EAL domain-containing protein (putative c-di-GMP-specific phosphodiesterase class I)